MLRKPSQHAMARASTAVSGRVFVIASSTNTVQHHGFRQFSSDLSRLYSPAAAPTRPNSKSYLPRLRSAYATCARQTLTPRSSGGTSFSIPRELTLTQIRRYASQIDGLGQSETFREYRLRQEIEQRRRAIRELENDLLRSEIDVADARFHLNLQELASLPV